ncbi:hypothetical protein ACI3LY_004925 [Candidozyma auris]
MPNYQIFYKLYEILPLWNFLWHRLAMAATGPVVNIDAQLASEAHMKCEIELNQLRPSAELSDALKSINEAEKQASNLEKMLDDLDRKMDYLLEAMADNKQEADKETTEEAKE